jgi:hypothetical protein
MDDLQNFDIENYIYGLFKGMMNNEKWYWNWRRNKTR